MHGESQSNGVISVGALRLETPEHQHQLDCMMIPESEGATPFGIFLLADSFLQAAKAVDAGRRGLTSGPTRLLCYHACELFLKCYLRSAGRDIEALRALGHNLHEMAVAAQGSGLVLPARTVSQAKTLADKNDYVRVRYMVVEKPGDIRPEVLLARTESIRESVRLALGMDPLGNPHP
ncbi:HEPN domain-containing protein [Mesorhizobium mediterraneum]|nr:MULTISPECIES: hypothetical protein [Mesorhizobium]RUU97524.1 hypothetical protein EOB36_26590 [Mesorhizobium sp. M6A.T.Cr.TU.017.01.1.1]RWN28464.1 MAG: hypothetical protein EOR96_32675 [Mesorhizobium sp.]RWP41112.1 MAG: hypothetical protein EOR05_31790 [Mesorhizobium sp.]RWP44680.1 MAG: hypothetical protein EOR06_31635 [Mesorhizobium sp.]RWP70360.1 MAG: hypothetical protein EOR10_31980 [Mesorhizobium sp.]